MKAAAMRRIIAGFRAIASAGPVSNSLHHPKRAVAQIGRSLRNTSTLKATEPVRMHPMHRSRLAAAAALSHRSQ